jgi:uncharacterized membrane protein
MRVASPLVVEVRSPLPRLGRAAVETHYTLWLAIAIAAVFSLVFGLLGVNHHRNYGTWSYDMAIYDQGFWLVSRGESFMTVRGLDFWGHHLNLVALVFVPFYWLGAGPSFLYLVQAVGLGMGAVPVYLIARDRFAQPLIGLMFSFVYAMYAPIQWISWANFHPEALVITPLLYGWWFAQRRQWRPFFIALLVALSMREDTALAVVMLGFVLALRGWRSPVTRKIAAGTAALGAVWYLVATRLFLPAFNGWAQPFYIEYFYGSYGSTMPEIGWNILKRPDRVVSDATQPDRLRFYRDLLLPLGALPLAGFAVLLVAAPQMLASVIGASPYARQIRYQYTSVMIAPIIIASIEGAWALWRFQGVRRVLPVWLLLSSFVSNVAWSPSPISKHTAVWSGYDGPNGRLATLDAAVAMVPEGAAVTASYTLLPHLAHRKHAYDWPNPFVPAYWGNDNCDRLPAPTIVEWIVIDRFAVGDAQQAMFEAMIADGGPFEVQLDVDNIVVAKRVGTDPFVDEAPQAAACVPVQG